MEKRGKKPTTGLGILFVGLVTDAPQRAADVRSLAVAADRDAIFEASWTPIAHESEGAGKPCVLGGILLAFMLHKRVFV